METRVGSLGLTWAIHLQGTLIPPRWTPMQAQAMLAVSPPGTYTCHVVIDP
jgi:hypothetical protein